MNKIGFKNFRRFQNFEALEYTGITFLVGRNNAGKSTIVKALLLIDNYFKSNSIDRISFGNNVLENANIVTFGRALNNEAKKLEENYISFTYQIEDFLVEIAVSGDYNDTSAYVLYLDVTNIQDELTLKFDITNRSLTIIKNTGTNLVRVDLKISFDLQNQIKEIKEELAESTIKKTSDEFIQLNSKLKRLIKKQSSINKNPVNASLSKQRFELSCEHGNLNSLTEILEEVLTQLMVDYRVDFDKVQEGKKASKRFEDLRALKEFDPKVIEYSFSHFMSLMKDYSIAYMGANPTKQSALFSIRDKNNGLAQAIHDYKQLNIKEGEEEHRFVLKWMNEFEVGTNFGIIMHGGEAYEMMIHSNDTDIHLADKGMGSIQAMLIIMRIACVIKRVGLADKNSSVTQITNGKSIIRDSPNFRLIDRTTIIVEEPELNLHPALQSKLADLFLDVHQKFKIDFLIETHSEYILRRSQVMVAVNEFEIAPNENPFCVYYFPKDLSQMPYKLEYQQDGSFNRNFGDGFFDEASSSTLELLKIKRQKKSDV